MSFAVTDTGAKLTESPKTGNSSPYKGPRPFEAEDAWRFFGREREAFRIAAAVAAHSTVLLYAQSGTGKTSLINARLIPMLKRWPPSPEDDDATEPDRFHVIGPMFVGGPEPDADRHGGNPFVFNALVSCPEASANEGEVKGKTLAEFLQSLHPLPETAGGPDPMPPILIFDQFEELFTYPARREVREEFFRQIAGAFRANLDLRVLFAMREEYIARIRPFVHFLPDRLRSQIGLERLSPAAALQAITGPVNKLRAAGRTRRVFEGNEDTGEGEAASGATGNGPEAPLPGAAGRLVEKLRDVDADFVEPLHLQVVAASLWRKLPAGVEKITEKHVNELASVGSALREFYETCIQEVIEELDLPGSIDEKALRTWFAEELISKWEGLKQVHYDPGDERRDGQAGGMPEAVVKALDERHIIRSEERGQERWYLLAHRRLIEPIRESNAEFEAEEAKLYEEELRRETDHASERAESAEQEAERAKKAKRRLLWGAGLAGVILLVVGVVVFESRKQARLLKSVDFISASERFRATDPRLSLEYARDAYRLNKEEAAEVVMLKAIEQFRKPLASFKHRTAATVAVSPGGTYLISYAYLEDTRFVATAGDVAPGKWPVILWNVNENWSQSKPLEHGSRVTVASMSENEQVLATLTSKGKVRVWQRTQDGWAALDVPAPTLKNGANGGESSDHSDSVTYMAMAISPSGRYLAAIPNVVGNENAPLGTFHWWQVDGDPKPPTVTKVGDESPLIALGFAVYNQHREVLVALSYDGASVWQLEEETVRPVDRPEPSDKDHIDPSASDKDSIYFSGIQFSPSATRFAVWSQLEIHVHDLSTGQWQAQTTARFPHDASAPQVSFDANDVCHVAVRSKDTVRVWSSGSDKGEASAFTRLTDVPIEPTNFVFSNDGSTLAVAGQRGHEVHLYRLDNLDASPQIIDVSELHSPVDVVALSDDTTVLAVAGYSDPRVMVYRSTGDGGWTKPSEVRLEGGITGMLFAGHLPQPAAAAGPLPCLVTSSDKGRVCVWDWRPEERGNRDLEAEATRILEAHGAEPTE